MFDYNIIGVDAIKLSGLGITGFNGEKAKDHINKINKVDFGDETEVFNEVVDYSTGEIIKINDLIFNFYKRDTKYKGLNQIRYKSYYFNRNFNSLNSTLPTVLFGNNINNIGSEKDIEKSINILDKYLDILGFKTHDIYSSLINEIEINVNVPIKYNFLEYKNVVDFFRNQIKDQDSISPYHRGFVFSNDTLDLKIYDKKYKENMQNLECCEDIMRIEVKYKKLHKRKALKNIRTINDLINGGLKLLKEEFIKDINKLLYAPIIKNIKDQYDNCLRWIEEGSKSPITTKLHNALMKGNDLIDILILIEALRKTEHPSNYAKAYKRAIDLVNMSDNPSQLIGNLAKINEIFKTLGFTPYIPNVTPSVYLLV